MRGYHIRIGYNGGGDAEEEESRWQSLIQVARSVANNPQRIVAEARRLGAPERCTEGCCELSTFADNYANEALSPVSIIDQDGNRQIMQLASTSDDEFKYCVRRAYVRLVIEEMHRLGIEVSLTVA